MLEKVNLHLEALRMPTANHDVEVHLARQALRALSEAVTKDAGETIAAMKLHRRSQNEIKMLRERSMLLFGCRQLYAALSRITSIRISLY